MEGRGEIIYKSQVTKLSKIVLVLGVIHGIVIICVPCYFSCNWYLLNWSWTLLELCGGTWEHVPIWPSTCSLEYYYLEYNLDCKFYVFAQWFTLLFSVRKRLMVFWFTGITKNYGCIELLLFSSMKEHFFCNLKAKPSFQTMLGDYQRTPFLPISSYLMEVGHLLLLCSSMIWVIVVI